MNRSRDGFTLVELLVVMVLVTILSAVVGRVMINGLRVSQAQMVQAGLQSNVRVGGLVVPLELREIGYDSNITTNAVTSDIEVMGNDHIQFLAMRGLGLTCGTPALNELRIQKPAMSYRPPRLNDGFLFFVENDPNTGLDDQWIPLAVTAIDYNSLCGADSAIALTMGIPQVAPMVNLALSQIFVGGPVRFFERVRFGAFVDADGLTYLGARSVSLGEGSYRAVAGPIDPANGLRFRYFNRAGAVLDPATANPVNARLVELTLQGLTAQPISLAGSSQRATNRMTVESRVALRNTLRH